VGGAPFTDRLVAKFGLPVAGWRGGRLDGRPGAGPNDGSGGGEETAGGHA
jgi:hypothetical protein